MGKSTNSVKAALTYVYLNAYIKLKITLLIEILYIGKVLTQDLNEIHMKMSEL